MTLPFWLGAVGLTVLALSFLAVPLWIERVRSGRLPAVGAVVTVAIVPVAFVLYLVVTTYDPDAVTAIPGASNEEIALLQQLAARLADEPDDLDGWLLLGRSYRALGDYPRARQAFEQAWNRTEVPDDGLKLNYAESMLFADPRTAQGLAGDLIEEVLANSPQNQAALWLGAIVAAERNRTSVAVDRFTTLLDSGPPPDVAEIIRDQLMSLTGALEVPVASPAVVDGPVLEITVSVSDEISLERFGPSARMFLLARSTDMPAPIAVKPVELSALPGTFTLSDADAMLAGRSLAQYATVNVVARISASGTASEQPGDAYAEAVVAPVSGETINLVIDKIVPGG
jgi:cytochrome c-type biogenesis protein CcmH